MIDRQAQRGAVLRVVGQLEEAVDDLRLGPQPGVIDLAQWESRVRLIDAKYEGAWELPALGAVTAPAAVLLRPDGYVAWVGDLTQQGLAAALTTWFGPAASA